VFKVPRVTTIIMGKYPNLVVCPFCIRRESLLNISEYTLNNGVSFKTTDSARRATVTSPGAPFTLLGAKPPAVVGCPGFFTFSKCEKTKRKVKKSEKWELEGDRRRGNEVIGNVKGSVYNKFNHRFHQKGKLNSMKSTESSSSSNL
jgi:hypothetical protein